MIEVRSDRRWGMLVLLAIMVVFRFNGPSLTAKAASGNEYYVDSVNGSDSNPGASEDKPWRTLAPVHARDFLPGDVVHF